MSDLRKGPSIENALSNWENASPAQKLSTSDPKITYAGSKEDDFFKNFAVSNNKVKNVSGKTDKAKDKSNETETDATVLVEALTSTERKSTPDSSKDWPDMDSPEPVAKKEPGSTLPAASSPSVALTPTTASKPSSIISKKKKSNFLCFIFISGLLLLPFVVI